MLAHERFSDRPLTVCPVLAAFLRAYNDHLPQRLRAHLYAWASDAIGTRDLHRAVIADRRRRLVELADDLNWVCRRHPRWDRCLCAYPEVAAAGVHVARAVRRRPELHDFVDQALRTMYDRQTPDIGVGRPVAPAPATTSDLALV